MERLERQEGNRVTKGIIFAADGAEELHPATQVLAKGLMPVYDKPMVYYPLSTLMLAGIKDILIVCEPRSLMSFMELLGNGSRLGISISYAEQSRDKGPGDVFLAAERFIGEDPVCLILADSIFCGNLSSLRDALQVEEGATIFAADAKANEGHAVVEFDGNGKAISLHEGPGRKQTGWAVPGLYMYDNRVLEIAELLARMTDEHMSVMDVNRQYLLRGRLKVRKLPRDIAWLEAGTETALLEAANFVAKWEKRTGVKTGCIEEAAFQSGYIAGERLEILIRELPESSYRDYLVRATGKVLQDRRKGAGKSILESSVAVTGGAR